MNPLIQLRKATRVFLVALACFGLSPVAQAQLPLPTPDGFYPGGNTAEGMNALKNVNVTTGIENTAIGFEALFKDMSGDSNTALGLNALHQNTTGNSNTANGVNALYHNNGNNNTAVGRGALRTNTTGRENTATGFQALPSNTTGNFNTATGVQALFSNAGQPSEFFPVGSDNTATGYRALYSNTVGFDNTAVGFQALYHNSESANGGDIVDEAVRNSAFGAGALLMNDLGRENTAIGVDALAANKNGIGDTAVGFEALKSLQLPGFGSEPTDNIALGHAAGSNLRSGLRNIYIGSLAGGSNRIVDEDFTIRIGNPNFHFATFIAGIRGLPDGGLTDAVNVLIDPDGQLGTVSSSRRFKNEIKPMNKTSEAILALKPVTFHFKSDNKRTPQFGLIAEEVAKVNPDLVVRDRKGEIYSVRYEAVNAMLLNEFLKEHRKNEEQEATIMRLQKQIEALTAGLQKVSAQLEVSQPAPQTVLNNQ